MPSVLWGCSMPVRYFLALLGASLALYEAFYEVNIKLDRLESAISGWQPVMEAQRAEAENLFKNLPKPPTPNPKGKHHDTTR